MACSLELIKQRNDYNEHIKAFEDFFKTAARFYKNYGRRYEELELQIKTSAI